MVMIMILDNVANLEIERVWLPQTDSISYHHPGVP